MERKNFETPPVEKPKEEEKQKFTKVKIICSWCNADMGEKEVEGASEEVTHSICEKCLARVREEYRKSKESKNQESK